jgi:hypothetical protein
MVKAGEICVIKTTGEKVFVLAVTEVNTARVRRPLLFETGAISHAEEIYTVDELESTEDHATRQVAEFGLKARAQKQLRKLEEELTCDDALTPAVEPFKERLN